MGGGDPVEFDNAWRAVAFQTEGLVDNLSVADAYTLLRAFCGVGVLARFDGVQQALLAVLQRDGSDKLSARKLIGAWTAWDRSDAPIAMQADAVAFFRSSLRAALPKEVPKSGAAGESDLWLWPLEREWRRALALLRASDCSTEELRTIWDLLEAKALKDVVHIRSLPIQSLVAAVRATSSVEERIGRMPSRELSTKLCNAILEQANWLDGWSASQAACALAGLRLAPAAAYDALRPVLLERCTLAPPAENHRWSPGQFPGLIEAERVARAMAHFDVHDQAIREQIAAWLLVALPDERFILLARDLAGAGLSASNNPKVARNVRARLRSSEMACAADAQVIKDVAKAYAQPGDE